MKILVIDDEESLAKILSKYLQQNGHEVGTAHSGREGVEKAAVLQPDVILLDLHLPDWSGMEVLAKLNETSSTASIVVITGSGSVDSAVQAMRMGAEDYLEKPIDLEKLKIVVRKIGEKQGLIAEVQSLKRQQRDLYRKDYLFLTDPAMQKIYEQIEQVARQEKVTALILGETGTGKEHIDRLIHSLSPRVA